MTTKKRPKSAKAKPARRKRASRTKPQHIPSSWLDGLAMAAILAFAGKALGGAGPAACAAHGEVGGDRPCAACGHARRDHCFCGRECLAPGEVRETLQGPRGGCPCHGFVETATVMTEPPAMFDGPGSPDDLMMRLWEAAEPVVGSVLDLLGVKRKP